MACFGIINLICTIALLRWKKWGFWGFGLSSIVIFVFNFLVAQLGLFNSLLGLLGTVLLYIVLQIGNQNKGWPQLE